MMVYFDNAATSKYKPKEVIDSMINVLNNSANPGRGAHDDSISLANEVFNTREVIKKTFNASQSMEVIFTKNTTEALNIAILGYLSNFRYKVHVITSMLEHNSILRPLKYLASIGKIDITILPIENATISISDIELCIHNNTKLIALNHTSNVLGTSINLALACEIASAYNIPILIDGAQALGHTKIDLKSTPITMLAGAGHKGLHGPLGSGFLIVDTNKVHLKPIMYGGTGTNSAMLTMPIEYPESFEVGTMNVPNIVGMREGILSTYNNFDTINNNINKLSGIIYNHLKSNKNVELYSPLSNVLSFNIKGYESYEIADYLNEKNIAVRSGLHCAPLVHTHYNTTSRGMVRVSVGANNTLLDVDMLINALDNIPSIK